MTQPDWQQSQVNRIGEAVKALRGDRSAQWISDATGTLGGITLNQTGREMECILLLMGFYLLVSLMISAVMNAYNNRVKLVER